jgi:TRAP-type C4-dicarboxylate transport system permease small subunit
MAEPDRSAAGGTNFDPALAATFDARLMLGPAATGVSLVGAVAMMVVACAIVVDVLMRWLFNSPILGVDDLSQYNLAVIVCSFFPVCLVGGHFVTVRFLGRALGTRGALWLEVFGNLCTLFIFVLFAWQFFRFTLYDVTLTGLATVVLEVPQAPWWWVVTALIWLCVPVQIVVVGECVLRAFRGVPRPSAHGFAADAGA